MRTRSAVLLAALAAPCSFAAPGVPGASAAPAADSRGAMLYDTHCITCHTTQVHWRDQHQARDWNSLRAQVRRWQETAGLQWSEDDITEVARHLNDTIYHLPPPTQTSRR
ncbi:MAG: cytochrome C [Ramlibacter sp.]